MLTAEQLEARKAGIGGSDVASILGLSPWKSQYQLYLEKRGELDEPVLDSDLVHFGSLLEGVVSDEYTTRTGEKLERRNKMLIHPKYPFMLANIDRKIVGRRAVFEAKCADKFTRGKWGEDGSEEIPDFYRTQVEHYFNVTGYDEGVLAVLIGGNEFRIYPIQRDPELSEMMLEACINFWDRVQKGLAPDMDFAHGETLDLLKKLYPGTNGETILLPAELYHWHKVKIEADAEVKKYAAVVDTCKARIAAALKGNAVGIIPDAAFQYKRSLTKRKAFTVEPTEFMVLRGSKYTGEK